MTDPTDMPPAILEDSDDEGENLTLGFSTEGPASDKHNETAVPPADLALDGTNDQSTNSTGRSRVSLY